MGDVLQFPWHVDEVPGALDIPAAPPVIPTVVDPVTDARLWALVSEISSTAPISFLTLTAAELRALIAEVASRRRGDHVR